MELWLGVQDHDGVRHDVAVDIEPHHTLEALLVGVTGHLGLADARSLTLARTGDSMPLSTEVSHSGIRSGDTILFGSARVDVPELPPVRLVVAGGPAAGTVAALPAGLTTIGRSSRATVKIEDPALSRVHLQITVERDVVKVTDAGSSNGTFLYGKPVKESTTLSSGEILEAGDSTFRIEVGVDNVAPATVRDGLVQFTRPPRVKSPNDAPAKELKAPPDIPQKRKIPLSSALLPLVAAPVMVAGTGNPSYLVMAALSPVMVAASVIEDRRSGRKDHEEKLAAFHQDLSTTSTAMADALRREVRDRWADYPDPADLLRRVRGPGSDLWERRRVDPDFLNLRVGWADQPSRSSWTMRDGGEPAKREEAEVELNQHRIAPAVPVVIDFVAAPVAGLAGPPELVLETARWLVAQAAVLHSPRDVVVAVGVTRERVDEWSWTTWLPHCRLDGAPMAAHPFAAGDEEARVLVAALNDLVAVRKEQSQGRLDQAAAFSPSVLLVLDEELQIPRSAVATLLEEGPACGIKVLWLGETIEGLPGETGTIVLTKEAAVTVTSVSTGHQVVDARPDLCPRPIVEEFSSRLAGIRDATARNRGRGDLPSFVALPELLGGEPTVDALSSRWQQSKGGLGAPIGIAETGAFSIDIRRDGPHALLGGTTGAGKSELLQTYVAALAANHPPTRLTFLLVDYKGGAAFKDCVKLPHVVGIVTDLDGHLVHRALVSLNAELHRRERLLASVGAKDLIEMERKNPDQAPASLLLIVDEFATLAKELPEFVDGVVNVAQRGRSLGIHMLLATQRPAGAINDNIRANTNLRMALRMNDDADSQDVIGTKHAAALPRNLPGRAFARTGASELTEVQVAYAGGHTLAGGDEQPIVVSPLRLGRVERSAVVRTVEDDGRPTDLQQLVAAAIATNDQLQLPRQPSPWLPALPTVLALDDLTAPGTGAAALFGLIDEPSTQTQSLLSFELEQEGSLLVYGTSGSGKTTLLRTLAVSLTRGLPPDELHLYALDFASRGLAPLATFPHVGSVIPGDDVERVQRTITMLEGELGRRRTLLADAGASLLSEYQRTDRQPRLPRIVVLLDGYSGFTSVFESIDFGQWLDRVPALVADGRALGIHWVITADRRGALPLTLTSGVSRRVVLRMADDDDYGTLGVDRRWSKGAVLPPGRGFVGTSHELQVAIVGRDAAGEAQMAAVEAIAQTLAKNAPRDAPAIVSMPSHVDRAVLPVSALLTATVGLRQNDLAPFSFDLADGNVFVGGPNRSGRSTALATTALALQASTPTSSFMLFAPKKTPLMELGLWDRVARRADECDALAADIEGLLDARGGTEAPIVVVIDDATELGDTPADTSLERLARRGKDVAVYVVLAADSALARRAYGGCVAEVRRDRNGILLDPDQDLDGDLLSADVPRVAKGFWVAGRGLAVAAGREQVVQVAQ